MGYNDGEALHSDEGIKLGLSVGKVIGTILGDVYGITRGIAVGTEIGSLVGYFDGSNDVNLKVFLLGNSVVYNDGKLYGSDEVIKMG